MLAYYAVFFFFGAVYWEMDDRDGQLGSWWSIGLPIGLLVVFPFGFDLVTGTHEVIPRFADSSTGALVGNLLQAAFTWLMVLGLIGACRRLLCHESPWLRYIADSSYWLYLVHLPLVILAQWLVRDMRCPLLSSSWSSR